MGTGEPNNRQSSSFGDGVYKSTDAGKTFTHVGLKETQSIARVLVHPTNPNIVYVAAIGHLFGPNKERGLYKTIDGGKTWTNTNFIDEDTGFTDVAMDPKNPEVLFAASYQRRRTPHGFNGGGPGSGLWKTTNGGKTWTRLKGNGLPDNPIIGRIGLDICLTKPNVIIAQFEVGASGGTGAGVTADGKEQVAGQRGGGAGRGRGGRSGGCRSGRGGRGGSGGQAGARGGQAGARGGQAGGAPAAPPDPNQSGVWRSDDGGKTWRVVSNTNNRPMYYSKLRVDPNNDQVIYLGGASAYKSVDGGKTFRTLQNFAHGDHHAIWVDPRNSNHVMYGNDGGLDVSYDGGETWDFIATMAVGQFYAISADMRKPYYVCGGLQDNGSWCGPSAKRTQRRHPELRLVPRRRWRRVLHAAGSDRLGHGLLRVAGRRRLAPRPPGGNEHEHPAARRRARARRARTPRRRRWRRRTRSSRPPRRRTWCPSRRTARRSGSSGIRRPCSRRTTRASS